MNWKELYALVNENIKKAVSGLYKPAGDVTFAELPELSQSVLGYTYTVTDAFTTDSRFTDYDTESQTGHSFPADTEVAVIVTGTTENPVYMFNVMGGIMDGYATKGDLDNYVEKEAGKSLSTNDYTDADKALVQNSPITTTATGSDLTLSTSSGNLNGLTVYGKSEIINGEIVSAGEGYATVDLGTLDWEYITANNRFYAMLSGSKVPINNSTPANIFCPQYPTVSTLNNFQMDKTCALSTSGILGIKDTTYGTDPTAFKSAMNGVILAYEEATPTNNTIAVKTDNGSGIDGTMAVFETGTPLYGASDSVRNVMTWDGTSGVVTKKCVKVRLADLTWGESASHTGGFSANVSNMLSGSYNIISTYPFNNQINFTWASFDNYSDNTMFRSSANKYIYIKSTSYANNLTDFVASLGDTELVYELATPTAEQLTATENASIAGLKTFTPQTHAQNNAGAEMTVEAYAGTANGKAVADLKSELQITQSDTLTLTVSGWTNNAQTLTYAHDTAKRNVIDVDPASVEEWAGCGVIATAETSSGITFSCKTVPTNALTFRVTSMGV